MKTAILSGEHYFGVEITAEGRLVVAERAQGRPVLTAEFPAGQAGAQALRRHIEGRSAHPHVCIKTCGAAALGLATALVPVPGIEVTLVSSQATQSTSAKAAAEPMAVRLARLAERLF
jgi:hypothetical protein